MDVILNKKELSQKIKNLKFQDKSIGFVPTMGALHAGHLSLIQRSVLENDLTTCSIFVNPLQFNNKKDLDAYPRDLDKDLELLEKAGCALVFTPEKVEFYDTDPLVKMKFGHLETIMEGAYRPGHFNGVAIVVARLLHLMDADRAYFGLKDLQQFYIISQMCKDLGFPTCIIPCEIVRGKDGLALSSRNRRLSPEDRKKAVSLNKIINKLKSDCEPGVSFKDLLDKHYREECIPDNINIEYLELVSLPSFRQNPDLEKGNEYAICIAAGLSGVRLIDNVTFHL